MQIPHALGDSDCIISLIFYEILYHIPRFCGKNGKEEASEDRGARLLEEEAPDLEEVAGVEEEEIRVAAVCLEGAEVGSIDL